ncbi:MAG: hypothetical protein HRU35_06560 [Rickettsiaceae bacterium]|nr:hypothetical protein [Rickettsiaceae bacterium]
MKLVIDGIEYDNSKFTANNNKSGQEKPHPNSEISDNSVQQSDKQKYKNRKQEIGELNIKCKKLDDGIIDDTEKIRQLKIKAKKQKRELTDDENKTISDLKQQILKDRMKSMKLGDEINKLNEQNIDYLLQIDKQREEDENNVDTIGENDASDDNCCVVM